MVRVHTLDIDPPVANASCAWASDYEQLRELYATPYTGAITTRTATLKGFLETDINRVVFTSSSTTSLNSYGYSPYPLRSYTEWAKMLLTTPTPAGHMPSKPVIISITSSQPEELHEMVAIIQGLRSELRNLDVNPALIAIELNTSCPNIKDMPPPSYNFPVLHPFLQVLADACSVDPSLTVGMKLPPYLYSTCFHDVIQVISSFSCPSAYEMGRTNPIAFITCVNTLGSALLFSDQVKSGVSTDGGFALPTPLGGLGGEAIHAVALGNVYMFSKLLGEHSDMSVRNIKVFGTGGVTSKHAAQRMYQAGALIVECATLLGEKGVASFKLLNM